MYIWPKCFFRFSLSLRHLNTSSNSKKWIPMLFAIKSSFKFPALATPNEVDRVMIDWFTNDVTSGISRSFMLFFCLLDDRIARPTSICLFFCRGKLLSTTETTVTLIRRIAWFLTWRHDPFRNPDPFLHWLTVNFIGRGWSGNFKARS